MQNLKFKYRLLEEIKTGIRFFFNTLNPGITLTRFKLYRVTFYHLDQYPPTGQLIVNGIEWTNFSTSFSIKIILQGLGRVLKFQIDLIRTLIVFQK